MKEKKKIEFSNYGTKEKQVKTGNYRHEEIVIPDSCRYRISFWFSSSICFMGRFRFGVKDQLVKLSKAFGIPTTSTFSKKTGVIVVDDLNRTNSIIIDRARKGGIVLLNEEEFLYLISSNKKNTRITYEKK